MNSPFADPKDNEAYDHDREILARRKDYYEQRQEPTFCRIINVVIAILIFVWIIGLAAFAQKIIW